MESYINNILSGISITDAIDILIVAFIIYKVLGFIRETRAAQLVKGVLVLVLVAIFSEQFHLYTLNWILRGAMTLGAVAIVIVFQPELRRGLEYMGRGKLVTPFAQIEKEKAKAISAAFVKAIDEFSAHKTGALIVIERETALKDIGETGTLLDAEISAELLGNLFYVGSPLHDGAVIIKNGRIYAAGCVLPLTQNKGLSKELGTRHRAGIGITENSDAVAFIVSEESGIISMAIDGKLSRFLDLKTVEKTILNLLLTATTEEKKRPQTLQAIYSMLGGKGNDQE
ncbi:MAG: TIGR00159 family protein [Clostridiales bacterium]|jgi:hypothetical protein|nr:TIGR00159 family protein [Clostridiales bacterium]